MKGLDFSSAAPAQDASSDEEEGEASGDEDEAEDSDEEEEEDDEEEDEDPEEEEDEDGDDDEDDEEDTEENSVAVPSATKKAEIAPVAITPAPSKKQDKAQPVDDQTSGSVSYGSLVVLLHAST